MGKIQINSNEISSPTWAGDFMSRDHLVPGGVNIDAVQFKAVDAVVVTADGATAASGTTLNIAPLSGPIPADTILHFGAGKFARLTAAAVVGDIALTVEALPNGISDNDQATYKGLGKRVVASGTAVGRTYAEREAGTDFGPAEAGDDEVYLVAFENPDAERQPTVELYRHGGVVKENFLPNFASLAAGVVAQIRASYTTTIGVA